MVTCEYKAKSLVIRGHVEDSSPFTQFGVGDITKELKVNGAVRDVAINQYHAVFLKDD